MDVRFECPTCKQRIAIDESAAGLRINCPNCQTTLTVPAVAAPAVAPARKLPGLKTAKAIEAAPPPAAPPPPAAQAMGKREKPGKRGKGARYACNNPSCGTILYENQVLTQHVAGKTLKVCPKCRLAVTPLPEPKGFLGRLFGGKK